MRTAIFILSVMALFSACKEPVNPEAEVMAIHDEVMPKMGEIHLARKSLKEIFSKTNDEVLKTEITRLMANLDQADEGMMVWMEQWKVPEDSQEKSAYFLKEKEKITKVKHDMLNSLQEASNFIKNSQK
jgi:hypothetical protein